MPMINGRYYMNPGYGQAVESDRIADAFRNLQLDNGGDEQDSAPPADGGFLPNLFRQSVPLMIRQCRQLNAQP